MSWLWDSIVAYFCLNNNRGNWIIVVIHFPRLFPDFSYFPWLFLDHFSIPWLFQVFQKSGHGEPNEIRQLKKYQGLTPTGIYDDDNDGGHALL